MGLFGFDANKSNSAFTQANATTQTGNAYGAVTGKGGAASNASGTTTIGGGVKVGKNSTLVINNSNTQLENSLLEGQTQLLQLLQAGQSTGGDSSSSSGGIGGLFGGNSSKSGAGGKGGGGGDLSNSGNITLPQSLPGLEANQGLNTMSSNQLADALNSGGTADINSISHPPAGGFIFAPTSSDSTATPFPWGTVVLGVVAVAGIIAAVKFLK